mmetsp:Transcript_29961/g.54339  ORF Transcript_29961/g.54339 Transcript_29961/m.54339 type:complete len:408 (+) Transcript_29961:692-1915(+)
MSAHQQLINASLLVQQTKRQRIHAKSGVPQTVLVVATFASTFNAKKNGNFAYGGPMSSVTLDMVDKVQSNTASFVPVDRKLYQYLHRKVDKPLEGMRNGLIASAVHEGGFDRNRHYMAALFGSNEEFQEFFRVNAHMRSIPWLNWDYLAMSEEDFGTASAKRLRLLAAFQEAAKKVTNNAAGDVFLDSQFLNAYARRKLEKQHHPSLSASDLDPLDDQDGHPGHQSGGLSAGPSAQMGAYFNLEAPYNRSSKLAEFGVRNQDKDCQQNENHNYMGGGAMIVPPITRGMSPAVLAPALELALSSGASPLTLASDLQRTWDCKEMELLDFMGRVISGCPDRDMRDRLAWIQAMLVAEEGNAQSTSSSSSSPQFGGGQRPSLYPPSSSSSPPAGGGGVVVSLPLPSLRPR